MNLSSTKIRYFCRISCEMLCRVIACAINWCSLTVWFQLEPRWVNIYGARAVRKLSNRVFLSDRLNWFGSARQQWRTDSWIRTTNRHAVIVSYSCSSHMYVWRKENLALLISVLKYLILINKKPSQTGLGENSGNIQMHLLRLLNAHKTV